MNTKAMNTNKSHTITVTDNRDASRFEAHDDKTLAGFADYIRTEKLVAFVHTDVDPSYEGRGVGSQLARAGMESVRADQIQALAVCPFISAWLSRHPEYADLNYRSASRVTD
jgi:predicted GNAT family acetyltransferase